MHKHVFNFLDANSVITSLQSGFVQDDSNVNQLVDIYNTFSKALDAGLEVKAIFVIQVRRSIVSGTRAYYLN